MSVMAISWGLPAVSSEAVEQPLASVWSWPVMLPPTMTTAPTSAIVAAIAAMTAARTPMRASRSARTAS